MNIVFTGSRNMREGHALGMSGEQRQRVEDILLGYLADSPTMHNGLCVGSDAQAHTIACKLGIPIIGHPGFEIGNKWRVDLECDEIREVAPPTVRDKTMVSESQVCIATPCDSTEQWKGGTWLTFHEAQKQGLRWHLIWPDGTVWEGPHQTIELNRDLGRDVADAADYGLRAGTRHEVHEGFGDECGTTRADGAPTGSLWIRCPKVPVVRNKSGDIVSWKSAFVIVKPEHYAVVAGENLELTTPSQNRGRRNN